MACGIKIVDEDASISLTSILNNIEGQNYFWSVLYLEARGDLGNDQSMLDLEKTISESKDGIQFTWPSLNNVAGKLDQVIDIVLIGCRDQSMVRRFDNDEEMYAKCDLVIEMIDSSYWLVHSQEESLVAGFSHRFDVEPV